tara:strand:+ start:816 stop:941 length:126 start_codon:yes stop_codon:yes gene_type:complete
MNDKQIITNGKNKWYAIDGKEFYSKSGAWKWSLKIEKEVEE